MMISSTTCKGKEGGGRKGVRACVRVCVRESHCQGVELLSGIGDVKNQYCQSTFASFHKEEASNMILVFEPRQIFVITGPVSYLKT